MEKKSPRKKMTVKKVVARPKSLGSVKKSVSKSKGVKKVVSSSKKSALKKVVASKGVKTKLAKQTPSKAAPKKAKVIKLQVAKPVVAKPTKSKEPQFAPVPKSLRITKAIKALPKLSEDVETTKSAPLRMTVSTSSKSQSSRSASKDIRTVSSVKAAPKTRAKKKAVKIAIKPVESAEKESAQMIRPILKELPFSYNQTRMVLMVRDPLWAYTYWDFSTETWTWISSFFAKDSGARPKLRIHNLDHATSYDMDISLEAKNWYLELGMPNTSFEVELGMIDSRGKFHSIIKSNRIRTPRNTPSDHMDHKWESSELEFAEIYRLSGGGKNVVHGSEAFSSLRRRSS